jgi:Pvc16 N-terminal domain
VDTSEAMATYPAIAATSEAVLGVLQSASAGSEFDGVTFAHYSAKSLEKPMDEGISLYLYRITVTSGRNRPSKVGLDGKRYRPAFPLDLHYLLTAWALDPIKQQRMFGWAIRTLEDTPLLPAGVLNRHGPEPDVFRPSETVELVWEIVSQQDLSDLWEPARLRQQPSATYLARMVELESRVVLEEHPAVQTRDLGYA